MKSTNMHGQQIRQQQLILLEVCGKAAKLSVDTERIEYVRYRGEEWEKNKNLYK